MTVVFRIDSLDNRGKGAIGSLEWRGATYTAVSGPYGLGRLPLGDYEIRRASVVEGPDLRPPYCVVENGRTLCWFIPLTPLFPTSRSGFGIHPDGNVPGSEGCIVMRSPGVAAFWDLWSSLPISERPTRLRVEEPPDQQLAPAAHRTKASRRRKPRRTMKRPR